MVVDPEGKTPTSHDSGPICAEEALMQGPGLVMGIFRHSICVWDLSCGLLRHHGLCSYRNHGEMCWVLWKKRSRAVLLWLLLLSRHCYAKQERGRVVAILPVKTASTGWPVVL